MSPTQASSGSVPTSLTTPQPRKRKMTAPLYGLLCTLKKIYEQVIAQESPESFAPQELPRH